MLLDRANRYNASILTDIRDYQRQVDQSQRALNHERNRRRADVAELKSLRAQIDGSIAAEKRRYRGLPPQGAPPDPGAPRGREGRLAAGGRAHAPAAGRVRRSARGRSRRRRSVRRPGRHADSARRRRRLARRRSARRSEELGTPYVWGGAAPGGFDCSGLVSWAYAQAGLGGLPHFTGALWASGTHISAGELAPGDLVFYNGLNHVGMYIGGGNFVEAPHTGDVVKITSMASRSGFVGAVRVTG